MPPKSWAKPAAIAALVALAVQLAPGEYDPSWSDELQRQSDVLGVSSEHAASESLSSSSSSLSFQRIEFPSSRGEILRGRLFLPIESDHSRRPAVIVMAHGLGLSQDCRLEEPFVQAFTTTSRTANNNWAVVTLDYASFGASTGTPRHQVHPQHHLADLRAALAQVRQHAAEWGVDGDRIALWGTSFGGGHVMALVSEAQQQDQEEYRGAIRAVVAQVPSLASAFESVLGTVARDPVPALWGLVQVAAAALKWCVQWTTTLGKASWYIPLTGHPGSAAVMQNEGDYKGYMSLIPQNGGVYGWRNAVTLPSALRILQYRPLNLISSKTVNVPVLLIAAEKDTLCPASYVEQAARRIGRTDTELLILPGAQHFDVYSGKAYEKTISATIAFLEKHLK